MSERTHKKSNWSSTPQNQDSALKLRRFTTKDDKDEEIQQSPDINLSKFSVSTNPPFPDSNIQRQEEGEKEDKPELDEAIQTKLTVGEPGDKYEQEADTVAAKVVEQINSPQANQPVQGKIEPVVKPSVMRQGGAAGGAVNQDVEQNIQQARGSGQGLAENVRQPMEQAFGADFRGVKVHTDGQADVLNSSLNSRAFATGQDIFFKQGEYNPGSRGGQELLAHELTHVVQQGGNQIQCQLNQEKEGETYWEWWKDNKDEFDWRCRALKDKGYKIRRLVKNDLGKWEKVNPKNKTLVSEVGWSILAPESKKWEWITSNAVLPKLKEWLHEDKKIPYNENQPQGNSRIIDPDMQDWGKKKIVSQNEKWNPNYILHVFSQIGEGQTRTDSIRCAANSVLAVHIHAGSEAVRRVAYEILDELIKLERYYKHKQKIESVKLVGNLKPRISSFLNDKKTEDFTYNNLSYIAEGMYFIANAYSHGIDNKGTNENELKKISDIGHGKTNDTDKVESGEISPGLLQEILEKVEVAARKPRQREGKAAIKGLPKIGTIYTDPLDLHSLAKQLRQYQNVGLILSVPFENQSDKTGHDITLGVDGKGHVYLYDPWPRSGSQILYYPRNLVEMEKYFLVKVIVEGHVAAASPGAALSPAL